MIYYSKFTEEKVIEMFYNREEEIRDKEIRVISDDGEQLGIMSAAEALKIAESRNLDLVKIAPMAKPPVCKVMDYGKFRFEKAKKEKLKSAELLLQEDGNVKMIRRAETPADYFATFDCFKEYNF